MPLNTPALTTLLASLTYRPGLVVPHLTIPNLSYLSWQHAHSLGVRSIVVDKDNCLTAPRSDSLHPDLAQSWKECLEVFGRENVLIVSNSAGCAGETVGAQVVSRELDGATVLVHQERKPGKRCTRQVVEYFEGVAAAGESNAEASSSTSTPSPPATPPAGLLRRLLSASSSSSSPSRPLAGHILVIGDRITTDTVLAHRIQDVLRRSQPTASSASAIGSSIAPQAVAILTTHLWAHEGARNAFMRRLERWLRTAYVRRGIKPGQVGWRGTAAATVEERQGQWWRGITMGPPEEYEPTGARSAPISAEGATEAAAAEVPQRPPPLRDPTLSVLLSSRVRRLSFLPHGVRSILAGVVSSDLLSRTAAFFRDGWLLILRGCREGLNRPGLVFGQEEQVQRRRRHTMGREFSGMGAQTGQTRPRADEWTASTPSARRSYSTRPSPPSNSSAGRTMPRPYLWGTLAAMVLLPGAFIFGTSLSSREDEARTGEAAEVDAAVKRDEAAAKSQAEVTGETDRTKQAEQRQRHSRLGELEKRRYEIDEGLRDVETKIAVIRGRMERERAGRREDVQK
ncbi:hypothetical protein BDZ90DRAFT_259408 [Jaminaea rosea]|uniref:HAD-superfamily phosphatase n=1 Tax=Jaminaea rosea TaxID=1569628 RepID=A0A316UVK7_9BASI|nr:hypothetical protein BDZ90DRAFT_259408 [Jaminaea rosea]PWN28361.1 hypothetical protein BDZ90DRAFT_259408 [Jaminaea rosea]